MKKLLLIFFVFCSLTTLAQYPSTQTLGSDSTLVTSKGGLRGRLIPFRYSDTASANRERISQYSNAIIAVGNTLYMRDSTATKWIAGGGFNYSSTVSIANDSSIQICNSGVCDTFTSHKVVINNFTVLNDSLIQVCDGTTCDTIHINPTPIQKPYVDSVKAIGFSLYYYINGMAHLGGTFHVDSSTYTTNTKLYNVIDSLSQATNTSIYNVVDSLNGSTYNTIDSLAGTKIDSIFFSSSDNADTLEYLKGGVTYTVGIIDSKQGIITGCQVYYISGLTYGITSGVYKIGTTRYNYPGGTVTLPAADPTYTTRDIIALDSTGAIVIQGTPSANPASPQVSGTQIELIEVQVNPTATTPANTSTQLVYDENVEWMFTSFGLTVDPANTTAPFHGTKDIYTSAGTSGNYFQLNDTTTHSSTDYSNLTFHIKLNGALNNRSNISVQFFNGTVNVSNGIILGTTYGFNKSVTSYQTVVIPITQFNFSSSTFDRVRFIYTGTNFQTFYTDYIQLQSGVPSTGGTGGTFTQIQSNWAQLDSTQVDFIKNKPNISQQISDSLAKPDTIGIYNMGSGIHMIYANGGDTLFAKTLVAGSNVTLTQNSDSSVTINATGGGSGNTNIGAGFQLAVASTNNIKTIFGVSPILLDSTTNVNAITIKFDSTWAHSTAWNNTQYGSLSQQNTNTSNIATNTIAIAGKQNTLTLTTTGTSGAATLTGATLNIPQYGGNTTLSTLTDGATITWDYSTQSTEAKVTIAGNRTLSITNLPSGKVVYLTLGVIQDATGSRTLTLPASTKVINGGAGAVTLTTTANAIDILSFRWNGTTLFCTYGKNYN